MALNKPLITATMQRIVDRNIRTLPAADLAAGMADLSRAGVNAAEPRARLGKRMLEQLLAESERRASRNAADQARTGLRARLAPGGYSLALAAVLSGPAPVKHSQYR